jgi:hypothetical protein
VPELTTDQILDVAQKSAINRPTIYDAGLQTRRPINNDTEVALILLSSEQKSKAAAYLKAFAESEDRSSDITEVLQSFSDQQISNYTQAEAELNNEFSSYDQFREGLLSSGNETIARGLAPLLQSLSDGIGKLKSQRDSFAYDSIHNTAAAQSSPPTLTLDQKKELLSWVPVLTRYS